MRAQPGEVWFADFGFDSKPRWVFVISNKDDGRLALASVLPVTTQFEGTPYEMTLPRVPWLREQSYLNAQALQPVKRSVLIRQAKGKFDRRILTEAQGIIRAWLA